ncbi:response regulator [Neobacillus sp. YIM B06451]|uniref:response regulator transcription factor n=1 Tax=Neobacillus sp. YIM B06451 TaxID=3070994 RepID=UPI00292F71C6|nr:response regulator [Neobacillus sp. YIM B06451]
MKRILLAEDEEILRMLVMDTLEDSGFEIDEAADGKEALDLIKQNTYDLIMLDYMMPVYTGFEIIEMIREKARSEGTKIVMLSAKSQQYEQDKVLAAGADYFISKPFSPAQLLGKVEEILNGEN